MSKLDNVFIAIQSYNRHEMLLLMEQYLYDVWSQVHIFDDGSTDERIKAKYGDLIVQSEEPHELVDEAEANYRCGEQRRKIVDYFLEHTDKEYLMLLDDDIIITPDVIEQGVEDLQKLEQGGFRVGIYSFHTWMKDAHRVVLDKHSYGVFSLTGESCCILPRKALEYVGNHFGNSEEGYLNTHVKKMREKGYHLMCRLTDPHPVQHIGISSSSHIHKDDIKYWHRGLWRSYEQGHDYLRPRGFNPEKYVSIVYEAGVEDAPAEYLDYLEFYMDKKSNVISSMDRIKGRGKLTILDAKTKEVVDVVESDNTFVNGGYVKLLYLLAADSSGSAASGIEFGTSTTSPSASDTRSSISAAWDVKTISSTSVNESSLSVTLTASLLSTEGNGFPVAEVGLIAADGTLLARTTFAVQNKTNDFIYVIDWTLQFTS